ncbi:hypothetical protein ACFY64_31910 [Streptomyces collinus]|uniref:hypothetical protein n=1 Tax=Streptomyces collinus TaxID=42684 RepID=UPI0036A334D6
MHIGAVIAAVAALGGLIFTAITSLYGAKVAQDQLEQSQEDSDRAKREQASRVSYWVDIDGGRLHLANRSLDPVQEVRLWFTAGSLGVWWQSGSSRPVRFAVYLRSVPPCSEVLFERKDFRSTSSPRIFEATPRPPLRHDAVINDAYKDVSDVLPLYFDQLEFVDRDGVRWRRDRDADLEEAKDWKPLYQGGKPTFIGVLVKYPPVKPLKNCKDG